MAKNQPMTPPAGDEIFLLKMGEMVLKGLNRRTFEERLMGNARRRLEKFGKFRIYSRQSITYIEPKTEDCDMDGAFETLTRLFGVVGLFGLPILLSLLRYLNETGTISLFPNSALGGEKTP